MINEDNSLLFIAASELRRLRCGSYESKIEDGAAIARKHFGDRPFEVVATRENGVVVLSEGRCQLVSVEGGETKTEDLDVATKVSFSIEHEARNIVDLFLEGASRAAMSRLEDLVPNTPSSMSTMKFIVEAKRPWRSLFEARRDEMEHFASKEATSDQLHQKFARLYDEPTDGNAQKDLEGVVDRVAVLKESVETSLGAVSNFLLTEKEPTLDQFKFFSEDLLDDLRMLHKESSNAMTAEDDFYDQGVLAGIISSGLPERESASRFVVAVASKMIEAN